MKVVHNIDFELASSQVIAAELGRRLNELRLAQDLTQVQLAERAGVSRGTVVRLTEGSGVSLDTFIRVMQALGLAGHLAALLPDPTVRPVEEVRHGDRRQRASGRGGEPGAGEWRWGDEMEDEDEAS
ncbi:MAG: helix-turn-helix transcriptional regulator [Gammaproteobacteria bacterium]|nr:helix-turn-helix transcriptional regulator [Gammaproteobacteria bacterium]